MTHTESHMSDNNSVTLTQQHTYVSSLLLTAGESSLHLVVVSMQPGGGGGCGGGGGTCKMRWPLPATGVTAARGVADGCLLLNKSDIACGDMVLKCRPSVRLSHPQLRLPPRHLRRQRSRLQSLLMTMIAI
jgi:hypothetical protein